MLLQISGRIVLGQAGSGTLSFFNGLLVVGRLLYGQRPSLPRDTVMEARIPSKRTKFYVMYCNGVLYASTYFGIIEIRHLCATSKPP